MQMNIATVAFQYRKKNLDDISHLRILTSIDALTFKFFEIILWMFS